MTITTATKKIIVIIGAVAMLVILGLVMVTRTLKNRAAAKQTVTADTPAAADTTPSRPATAQTGTSQTNASSGSSTKTSSLPPCPSETATGCDKSKFSSSQSNSSAGCTGKGTATFTASPIALDDLLYIQPMGLMVGGHVTPIDHGYFYIKGAMAHPATEAPVYAPIDGTITRAGRTVRQGDPASKADSPRRDTYDDDSLTIEVTCTFRIRFSNLTRFAGTFGDNVGALKDNQGATPNYAVKAGELIGYTGLPTAQGIDVWVENDELTLTGFVNPKQYTDAESWKTHMADFFEYTQEPLKSQLLALTERDANPRFGKIDYDQDGKLIGNWFREGSGGYGGNSIGSGGNYWSGHLAIVYDGNDANQVDISFGNYQGQAQQFATVSGSPDPAQVDQNTGLVKYELGNIVLYSADTGQQWDGQRYLPHLRAKAGPVQGVVLLQLTDTKKLKMEIFPGKTASQVSAFDDHAIMYER